jgi:hypothetical protein
VVRGERGDHMRRSRQRRQHGDGAVRDRRPPVGGLREDGS